MKQCMKYTLLVFLCSVLSIRYGIAQGTVKGKVTDAASGIPLAGATIKEVGTNASAMTNDDGGYVISVRSSTAILQISFLGYQTLEIAAAGRSEVNIALLEDDSALEEVVVIGYGMQTKKEVTGSITSLRTTDFNTGNIANPVGLMQGKVAGLNIVRPNGGDPNGGFQIQLRGLTTLSGGQGPLVIIDGVIGGDLNSVNVEEIESIDVLKDGSAAAIYGTRGTNGVIIITTKRAKAGETAFEFSTYLAPQYVTRRLENLTADEFRQATQLRFGEGASQLDGGHSTDWFKEVTRTPADQYYNLAMGGGTESFSYRAAFNYRTTEGVVRKTGNDRLQARMAFTQKVFDNRLNIDYNFTYAQTQRQLADNNVLQMAFRYNPTEPVYDSENTLAGGYFMNAGPFQYYNPVAMVNERDRDRKEHVITGSAHATLKLTDYLNASVFGSMMRESWLGGDYRSRYYPIGLGTNGIAERSSRLVNNNLLEATLDYRQSFGGHNLQVIGGYSYQEGMYEDMWSSNRNFDTDYFSYHNIGAGYGLGDGIAGMSSLKETNRLIAFFGRALYNFSGRYLLSASVRQEGSSRFGVNHKWGLFPAISAGWRINEERFMAEVDWVDELKLRAGYGVTGNQDIGNYQSLQLLSTGGRILYEGQWINTYRPASNPNPDLRWERKGELNLGVDFNVFAGRLYGAVDYYDRTTNDLLYTYNVPVPPNLYPTLYTNVGVIQNRGIEAVVNYKVFDGQDLTWTTTGIFNRNRNNLVSFSDQSRGYQLTDLRTGWFGTDLDTWTQRIVEGGPIGNFVAPVYLGTDENGYPIYKDNTGDGHISEEDREIVGNAYPKFQLGFNNTFAYRNWDLGIFFRGVFGHSILNAHRMYYENFGYLGGKNILRSALDEPNYQGIAEYSSRHVEDASYIKLDNVSIGYSFNTSGGTIKRARIYAAGQQLLVLTKYKGVDPEINLAGLEPGIDRYEYYPRTSTVTIGINMNF